MFSLLAELIITQLSFHFKEKISFCNNEIFYSMLSIVRPKCDLEKLHADFQKSLLLINHCFVTDCFTLGTSINDVRPLTFLTSLPTLDFWKNIKVNKINLSFFHLIDLNIQSVFPLFFHKFQKNSIVDLENMIFCPWHPTYFGELFIYDKFK